METRPLAAALCILAAMAIIGLIDNYVRVIAEEAGLWQFHAMRGVMGIPLIVAIALVAGIRLWPAKVAGVFGRTAAITVAMLIYFASLAVLPVPIAVAGLFSAPIFVLVFTWAFRDEPVGWRRWLAALVGFVGILLVVAPDPANVTVVALLPLAAGAFYAVANIATRAWCEGESAVTLTFYSFVGLCLAGIVGSVILTATGGGDSWVSKPWLPMTSDFLFWTAVQAVGSIVGVLFLIRGYQLGEASYVSIMEYVLMISAAFWGWVVWGETVTGQALIGMALIVASGAVIALRSKDQPRTPTRARA